MSTFMVPSDDAGAADPFQNHESLPLDPRTSDARSGWPIEPRAYSTGEIWRRRLARRIWGYDYFISYHWSSGGRYAVSLARSLGDKGYKCFLDRAEYADGDDWRREGEPALRHSQRLVVVATREAIILSAAVAREVEIFTARSRHVIPIVFGSGFTEEERVRYPILQRLPDSCIFILEEPANLGVGPTVDVIDRLVRTDRVLRRRTKHVDRVLLNISFGGSVGGWPANQGENGGQTSLKK